MLKIYRNSNVKSSFWPIGGVPNSSEAAGTSVQRQVIVDSDGDTINATPSSSPSSASSGIDELEYVDDDNDGCGSRGVRLSEHLEPRGQRNTNGLHVIVINQRRGVEGDDDNNDPYRLYNATPRLKPQDQNAKIDLEPLDIGEPSSPCDSCSSAHAESIPTAKRSLARVPIIPTSPTADAEDADTERTDVERKKRDRKHASGWPRRKALSAVAHDTLNASSPRESGSRETGLFWRSREADDDGSTALRAELASIISSDDDDERFMFETPLETSRRSVGPALTTSPHRKRPGSPYPFAGGRQAGWGEAGKSTMGLSIDIPDVALDSCDGEGKQ